MRPLRHFTTMPRRQTTSSDSTRRHGPLPAANVASEAATDISKTGRTEVQDSDDCMASRQPTKTFYLHPPEASARKILVTVIQGAGVSWTSYSNVLISRAPHACGAFHFFEYHSFDVVEQDIGLTSSLCSSAITWLTSAKSSPFIRRLRYVS